MELTPKVYRDVRQTEPKHRLAFYQNTSLVLVIDATSEALTALGHDCLKRRSMVVEPQE